MEIDVRLPAHFNYNMNLIVPRHCSAESLTLPVTQSSNWNDNEGVVLDRE